MAKKMSSAFPDDGDNKEKTERSQEPGDANTGFDPISLERSEIEDATPLPDPFDPASLRLSDDLHTGFGVKKALLAVPVRKPDKSWWIRVHSSEEYRLPTAVIELKGERLTETFLVAKSLWPELAAEVTFRPKLLVTAINRQGTLFLWEVNMPRPDDRADEWGRTAREAVNLAVNGWVRVTANMQAGCYDVFQATGHLSDPEWPDIPFPELLRVAFRDRFIDSLDHVILRKLRGEV